MDRYHEPHRAALRHRLGPVAHQGGEAGRRQLQDHRHQDLHLRRRARSCRQYRAPGARAHRRRAGRHQGHLAVRGAQADGQGRRLARRAQRRLLRLDRREDGHPRQFDLRDELRRRHRLAGRRGKPRPAGHVHDDERGPPRRRRARLWRNRKSPIRTPRSTPRNACKAARSRAPNIPTSRPIRSSCIRTCAAR